MNSRQLAKQWPFPRHKSFVRDLRKAAATWFETKGFPHHAKMSYCLSSWDHWQSNIILGEVAEYIEQQKRDSKDKGRPYPLHRYLHHGLSSQAMAFNLIGPLITRNDYTPLVDLLKAKGVVDCTDIASAAFEYEDRNIFNEDTGQPTSIDVVLNDRDTNPVVFIESKLVEQEFGGCSVFAGGDCNGVNPIGREPECFLHFIGRRYWKLMDKYKISDTLRLEQQCIFVAHYQFFREVLLALEKRGTFVLLCDDRSPVFHCSVEGKERGLMPFLTGILPPDLHPKVAYISTQELVGSIKNFSGHHDWIFEFEKKYGIV